MTEIPYPSIVPPIEKDRRTGLMVFGIFALVIGALASCVAIITPLGLLMASVVPRRSGMQQPSMGNVVSAIVVYAVVAAAFIAGGVGSIRTRRWARPLMLSVAWTWLIIGIFGLVFWIMMAPSMSAIMATSGGTGPGAPPAGFTQIVVVIMSVVMGLLYIVLPGVFILFYRSPHVKRTLEHFDPDPGWADRAPVSVFGLAVGLGVTALFTLTMLGYGFFPLFGALLTGPAAWAATVGMAASFGVAAWLVYRLSPAGWWLTMLISIVLPIMMIWSHYRIGAITMYERMGMPPEQIDVMRQSAALTGPLIPACVVVLGIAGIVYLMAVRKFFAASGASARGGDLGGGGGALGGDA
ncbi:MAG: hypothetical protein WBD40_08150 [Tepidisphaeraceae bacterium]